MVQVIECDENEGKVRMVPDDEVPFFSDFDYDR